MFKAVPKSTKEEILSKVRNGETVVSLANQYGISPKTIYGWIKVSLHSQDFFYGSGKVKKRK